MKPRFREAHPKGAIWTLSLLVVLLASSCGPAATAIPSAQTEVLVPATRTSSPTDTAVLPAATATRPEVGAAVATSRGPDLEATDPITVSLASGQLQLVEFFRFT